MLPKGNNCSISHGDKRWNSKNCLWGCWRKVILLGVGGASFFFCSNTPLHGQIVFSLDFSHHMTMWQLTSLENAKMHPKAKASSFPLNHIAQILF